MSNIVEMHGISKAFGSNQANDHVDFVCKSGEVLCLLGENGAGKTTLMNILYGMYKPDEGEIDYQGKSVSISSPRVAIRLGIQMVHQHFMLVPPLSVADNVVLGKETKKHIFYDRAKANARVKVLSEEYGLAVSPEKLVADLSVGEQQRVEIIKALYQGADVLILDEPTAVLTPQEVDDLFVVIRRLRESGKAIIMITHKLKETMAISDRIYVMRQGKMVAERATHETSIDELSQLMVGEKISQPEKEVHKAGRPIVSMRHVRMKNAEQIEILRDITLDIREREIVGIAGIEGNGQKEIIGVLTAMNAKWEGDVTLDGVSIEKKKTAQILEKGVSCIHADRQAYSIVVDMDVPNNMLMGYQQTKEYKQSAGFLDWKKIRQAAVQLLQEYDVRPPDTTRTLGEFSGGNQQKFVVGRELKRDPHFLIAAHPTRGVDIMATSFIHKQLLRLKEKGAGILLISSDLDELMELSDRIAVLYNGKIVDVRKARDFTLLELGRMMGGGEDAKNQMV